ncbi:hypothetical protein AB0K16_06415 [Nonomuraea jabiensis]|uniref:hypothetical protein n=1 Tax=Nonomuraea jabiensis TaxID=882448 RepID=UPI00343FCF5F
MQQSVWKARTATLGAVALAFVGSLALTAPTAEASASSGTAAAKTAQESALAICPVKVLRTTQRWYLQANGTFAFHNYFRQGSPLNIYQGETRKHGSIVVVKTTTVVGGYRFWVNQAHIAGTGGACRS